MTKEKVFCPECGDEVFPGTSSPAAHALNHWNVTERTVDSLNNEEAKKRAKMLFAMAAPVGADTKEDA